jgi:hypothetical protein
MKTFDEVRQMCYDMWQIIKCIFDFHQWGEWEGPYGNLYNCDGRWETRQCQCCGHLEERDI